MIDWLIDWLIIAVVCFVMQSLMHAAEQKGAVFWHSVYTKQVSEIYGSWVFAATAYANLLVPFNPMSLFVYLYFIGVNANLFQYLKLLFNGKYCISFANYRFFGFKVNARSLYEYVYFSVG